MELAGLALVAITLGLLLWVIYTKPRNTIETFLVTMKDYINPIQCPDYAVYDGHNYYLVYNNRPFDGQQNPLAYATESDMRVALAELGCPFADRMPVEYLRRRRHHRDPQESYDRVCNKRIALPKYHLDKCASTFGMAQNSDNSDNSDNINTSSIDGRDPIAPISTDDVGADGTITNTTQSTIQKGGMPFAGDKLEMIKHLSQFLDQSSSNVMADYDQQTCMIYEMTKDQQQLGNPEYLLQYAQAFQTGHVDDIRAAHGGTGAPQPILNQYLLQATDGAIPGSFVPDDYV